MPIYIGDYLADTMHLGASEHGFYLLLIFAYWRNGGPLKNDPRWLQRICKASAKQWPMVMQCIAPFFEITDELWTHKRIERELKTARAGYEKRSAAAMQRWSKADALHMQPQPQSQIEKKEEPPVAPQGGPFPKPAKVKRARGPKPVFPIDPDRQPDEKNLAYALKRGVDAEHEWPKFVNWCIANAILSADFGANWRTRCDNVEKRAGEPGRRQAGHSDTSLAGTIAEVARSIDRGRAGRNPDPTPEADDAPGDGRYSNDGRGEPVTIDGSPDSAGTDGVPERDEKQEPRWAGPEADGGEVRGRAAGVPGGHCPDGTEGMGEGGSILAIACGDQEGLRVAGGAAPATVGEPHPLDIPAFLRRLPN